MNKSKFYDFVEEVINLEGGYVNNPHDSGGATNYGITESTAREFGYKGDIRSLSKGRAKKIYKKLYWDKLYLDSVAKIHEDLAFELFDTGVNAGVATAGVFLQRALNVLNDKEKYYKDLTTDGIIGPKTLSALTSYRKIRSVEGLRVLTKIIDCLQGARYVRLCEQHEKNEEFMYGWAKHRLT